MFEPGDIPASACPDCNASFDLVSMTGKRAVVRVVHAPTCPFYGAGCNRAARRAARRNGGTK